MNEQPFQSQFGFLSKQPARIGSSLETATRRIQSSIRIDTRLRRAHATRLPDRASLLQCLNWLYRLIYPGFLDPFDAGHHTDLDHLSHLVQTVSNQLGELIAAAFCSGCDGDPNNLTNRTDAQTAVDRDCEERAMQIVVRLLDRLPEIRRQLSLDVQAAFDGDPAAHHTDEVILCYPGMRAITVHRIAHQLYRDQVPLIPRMMNEWIHSQTGIDIHPGAQIGGSFFIDHGTGVVIGETTVIGEHCKLYQGVTLGAKSFPQDDRGNYLQGAKRHPTLEDHVTVYAGATILGGDTVIGSGSVVNGGVFLTSSVPAGHVVQAPRTELKIRSNPQLPPGHYMI